LDRQTQEIAHLTTDELTDGIVGEFIEIASALEYEAEYYPIAGGKAIRQNNEKDKTDIVTAIYPVEYGERFVHYRVDIRGGRDRLVEIVISETIPTI